MKSFTRTAQLIGDETMNKLLSAHVAVFGLGGVGSWAVEALARSGVGHIRVVDFDSVKQSNINRQNFALVSTIGMNKTDLAKTRISEINPSCIVETRKEFVDSDTLPELLSGSLDVIIDAIDGLSSKVKLIQAGVLAGISVVSSMGAAGRLDPSLVKVGDISESRNCPLARFVRKKLHNRGIFSGIRCVYSTEKVSPDLGESFIEEDELIHGRKRKPLGSICHIPAIFGFFAAGEAFKIITTK